MASQIRFAVILLAAMVAAVCGKSVPSETIHKLKDITVVKDIHDFAANHPGLKLTPLEKEESKARTQSVRYSLGGRVQNDGLVAQGTDTYAYPVPNDVSLQLTYPESGTGAIVTYVEIVAQQSNDMGNAYVVAGGIGQRFISIIIEAKETDYFSYKAQYFGVN